MGLKPGYLKHTFSLLKQTEMDEAAANPHNKYLSFELFICGLPETKYKWMLKPQIHFSQIYLTEKW